MDKDGVESAALVSELSYCFEEGERLYITGGAADLGYSDIDVGGSKRFYSEFNFIGDMRDNLNGSAEISAPSFACDNVAVNSSGSIVAGLGA